MEPAIGLEPRDLLITNQLLYQLSYAGLGGEPAAAERQEQLF